MPLRGLGHGTEFDTCCSKTPDGRFVPIGTPFAATEPEIIQVSVSQLDEQCSYPMRPGAIAASGNCNDRAESVVIGQNTEGTYLWYRCAAHEGLIRDTLTGPVSSTVPQQRR